MPGLLRPPHIGSGNAEFATFGAHNSKCLVLPVEVAQSEPGNLVGSQSVDCAKEQDSPRADIGSVVAGGRSNESANFRPGKPLRLSVKFWDGWTADSPRNACSAPSNRLGVSEEGPKSLAIRRH
jgi:hypothetical protein